MRIFKNGYKNLTIIICSIIYIIVMTIATLMVTANVEPLNKFLLKKATDVVEYVEEVKKEISKGLLYRRGQEKLTSQMRVSHHGLRVMDCALFFIKNQGGNINGKIYLSTSNIFLPNAKVCYRYYREKRFKNRPFKHRW